MSEASNGGVSAHLEDLFRLIVADVEVKQLLFQVEPVAALLDSLRVVVNLEQEQHVVTVYLPIMLVNQLINRLLVLVGSHEPIHLRLLPQSSLECLLLRHGCVRRA